MGENPFIKGKLSENNIWKQDALQGPRYFQLSRNRLRMFERRIKL